MPQPIRFSNTTDVYTFLNKLEELGFARKKSKTVIVKSPGGKRQKKTVEILETDTERLAQHLFVSEDGKTYLLEDILHSTEGIEPAPQFVKKNGEKVSLAEIKIIVNNNNPENYSELLGDLIHNKPLAEALSKINICTKHFSDIKVPTAQPLNPFIIIYPVITPLENMYEEYAINDWLENLDKQRKEFFAQKKLEDRAQTNEEKSEEDLKEKSLVPHHPGNLDQPLNKNQLIPNHALSDLIWVNFQQRKSLSSTHSKDIINEYEISLSAQKSHLEAKKLLLEKKLGKYKITEDQYKNAIEQNGDLENKTLPELKIIKEQCQEQQSKISNSLVNKMIFSGITSGVLALGSGVASLIPVTSALMSLGLLGILSGVGAGIGALLLVAACGFGITVLVYKSIQKKIDALESKKNNIKIVQQHEKTESIKISLQYCNKRIEDINNKLSEITASEKTSEPVIQDEKKKSKELDKGKSPLRDVSLFPAQTASQRQAPIVEDNRYLSKFSH